MRTKHNTTCCAVSVFIIRGWLHPQSPVVSRNIRVENPPRENPRNIPRQTFDEGMFHSNFLCKSCHLPSSCLVAHRVLCKSCVWQFCEQARAVCFPITDHVIFSRELFFSNPPKSYSFTYTQLFEDMKAQILKSVNIWSEMGQQTTQGRKVYSNESEAVLIYSIDNSQRLRA